MHKLTLGVLAILIFAAAGCASGSTPAPTATLPPVVTEVPTATPTEAAPSGEEVQISIANFSFQPASITIPVGTTVVWKQEDSAAHTVTNDEGVFDSGTVRPGGTFQFIFTEPGTYIYHCDIHSDMTGKIIVTG